MGAKARKLALFNEWDEPYALPTLVNGNGNRGRELDAMLLQSDPLRRTTDPKVNEHNQDVAPTTNERKAGWSTNDVRLAS
jgi:hypothetical protein